MPAPGQPNNPSGTNGWQGFGTEEPYGQVTKDNALAAAAPLASGPITAPQPQPKAQQQQAQPLLPVAPPVRPPTASVWQQIAATPGASPLAVAYAEKAMRQ